MSLNKSAGDGEKDSLLDDASALLFLSSNSNRPNDGPSELKRKLSGESPVGEDTKRPKLEADEISSEAVGQEETDKKKTWPVSDEYIVDPDAGVITCICGFDDDDGFSIQCDHCFRWQHAICYGIQDIENVPEVYLCDVCEPRNVDKENAKKLQMLRLRNQGAIINNFSDTTESNEATFNDSHDNAEKKDENVSIDEVKYSNDISSTSIDVERNTTPIQMSRTNSVDARIRKDNPDNNDQFNDKKNKSQTFGAPTRSTRSRNDSAQNQGNSTVKGNNTNNGNTPDIAQAKKKQEVFYLSAKSSYEAMYLPMKKISFNDKLVGLFLEKHINDDIVQIVETNTGCKDMPIEVKSYVESSYLRTFPGFTKLGIYCNNSCEKGTLIHTITGNVDFKSHYLTDPRNAYRIWGTSKPKIFFHPTWPLYIDTRLSGNSTRYIRRSCKPNVEIATIKVLNNKTQKYEIKFMLKATKFIDEDEELHLPWYWDKKHIIWKIINQRTNATQVLEGLTNSERYLLLHSIDTILRSCDCACGNSSKDCNLLIIKKFLQVLTKQIKGKMSNRYKINEILSKYQGKRRRPPPILKRLERDNFDNQEKAKYLLKVYNAEKLKYLEDQENSMRNGNTHIRKSSSFELGGTNRFEERSPSPIIESKLNKPFKWRVLNNKVKIQNKSSSKFSSRPSSTSILIDPLKYSEKEVKNLEELPIIIDLKLDQNKLYSLTDSTKQSILENENLDATTSDKIKNGSLPTNSIPFLPSNVSVTKEQEKLNSTGNPIAQFMPSKKKLSFADYKKKLSK